MPSTIYYDTAKKENRDSLAQQAAPVFRIGEKEGWPSASLLSDTESLREMSPDRQPVTAANPGLRPSRRVAGRAKRFGREGCQKAIRAEELQPRGAKRASLVSPPGSAKPVLRKRTAC